MALLLMSDAFVSTLYKSTPESSMDAMKCVVQTLLLFQWTAFRQAHLVHIEHQHQHDDAAEDDRKHKHLGEGDSRDSRLE